MNCSDDKCFHGELKDQPDYCDGVEVGQLEDDEPEDTDISAADGDGDEGNHIILKILSLLENIDQDGVIEGVRYIDIRKPITHFFDKSVALHRHDGKILACSTFTEVKSEADDAIPSDNTSDGSSMNVALLSAVVLVSSTVALIFSVVVDVTVTKLVFFSLLKLCMVPSPKFGTCLYVTFDLRPFFSSPTSPTMMSSFLLAKVTIVV